MTAHLEVDRPAPAKPAQPRIARKRSVVRMRRWFPPSGSQDEHSASMNVSPSPVPPIPDRFASSKGLQQLAKSSCSLACWGAGDVRSLPPYRVHDGRALPPTCSDPGLFALPVASQHLGRLCFVDLSLGNYTPSLPEGGLKVVISDTSSATSDSSRTDHDPESSMASSCDLTTPLSLPSPLRLSSSPESGSESAPPKSPSYAKLTIPRRLASTASLRSLRRKSSATSDDLSDSSQDPYPAPSLFEKYGQCEKVAIGEGATAVVRLARRNIDGEEIIFAIKEYRKRRKNESEKCYMNKVRSEFCIASALDHPNVVKTVDLVRDERSRWCQVMAFCPGGDLFSAIKSGRMFRAEIDSYFKQILSGVAYLHSMGVAHRDIKPENIILDGKGGVKIVDFGVSDVFKMCWDREMHFSKGVCGSDPYLAPEIIEEATYDARLVDVWACAIVYFTCLQNELPWRMASRHDVSFVAFTASYASISPTPLFCLPRDARTVIKRMLNPDPEQRPQISDILAEPWVETIQLIQVVTPHLHIGDRSA